MSSVSAGQVHACAVISASSANDPGTVWCWGEDSYYELGTGTSGSATRVPQEVVALNNGTGHLTGATAVSTGKWHTCALVSGGVDCWGNNGWGQRGNPSPSNSDLSYPVVAGSIASASVLDSGDYFNCALISDHTITCWGDNSVDQLGTGKIGSSQTPLTVSGSWTTPAHVSVGGEHVCAIDSSDGSVWCWGRNNDGQLGNGSTTDSSTPVKVKGGGGSGFLTGVTQVSAGGFHTCAVKSDNTVWCWGADYDGQLGDGITLPASSSAASTTPIEVKTGSSTFLTGVTQVSAGGSHTCAVKSDNTAWCWGYNAEGQLGINSTSNSSLALQVKGVSGIGNLTSVTQVSAGEYHSCAVAGGYAYCWGDNSYGQLGFDSANASSLYPMEVWEWNGTGTSFLPATSVSAGSDASCAVDSSYYAYCWGHNYDGQLGNGASLPSPDKLQPVQVYLSGTSPSGTLLTGAQTVSVGPEHVCAYVSYVTGTLFHFYHNDAYCWGYNDTGQLGNDTLDDSSNPVSAITTSIGVTEVSAGGSDNDDNGVSCAMNAGSVECWGSNNYGQMGSPALPTSVAPVVVTGLP